MGSSRTSDYEAIPNSSNNTKNLTDLFQYGLRNTESPYINRKTDSPYIDNTGFEKSRKHT